MRQVGVLCAATKVGVRYTLGKLAVGVKTGGSRVGGPELCV